MSDKNIFDSQRLPEGREALLLFTHIEKCCGTSFRHSVIHPNIPKELIFVPERGWRSLVMHRGDYRFIQGHFPAGIEQFINPLSRGRYRKPVRVVMLREPLDHMISYASFRNQQSNFGANEPLDADAIIAFYQNNRENCNLQTRMISGFFCFRMYSYARLRSVERLILCRAKSRLKVYFDHVGFFERLEDDFKDICRKLSFNYVKSYPEVTRTRHRISVDELSSRQADKLRTLNYLDVQLYEYATLLWP